MSILTSLLRKAAPERFALYEEHVRYEKAKQFHNLRVTNGESTAHLRQEAARLAQLVRTTRDEQTRATLEQHQAGLATQIANKPESAWRTFNLSVGTHLRLWRQAADSFRAGYNRFSLAAALKRDVDNPRSGWLKATDASGKALPSESLVDILPDPTMTREEAIASIAKYGATADIGDTSNRLSEFPGAPRPENHSAARERAARAAFFKPIAAVGDYFRVASNSETKNGTKEHTVIAHPAHGSVHIPGGLGSASGHDLSTNPASEGQIISFFRNRVWELLLKKEALENSANPDPVALANLNKHIEEDYAPLLRRQYPMPTLAEAKIQLAENEQIKQKAIELFGQKATGLTPTASVVARPAPAATAVTTTVNAQIEPETRSVDESIYLDMTGAQAAKQAATLPRPAALHDTAQNAIDQFKRAWQASSGAASVELAVAKAALKAVAVEQFRALAQENPDELGKWRKTTNERFYAYKIELSNAHRAGDREAYLDALVNSYMAQAEYNEATALFFANKLVHPAQGKFVTIYERQAAKVTANNQPTAVLIDAQIALKRAARAHFAKTEAKITKENAQALLFEAQAKKTQFVITSAGLWKERVALNEAGHTPFTHERIDLRTRAALHNAAVYWNEEWIDFLQNKVN